MKASTLVRSTLLVIAAALAGAGCTTTDAYTGEKKVNNASKGAGIGAAAGAVLGALTGDNAKERRERALIGAGVGALTGAGVGAYMDKQEAKLRAQLQGTGVSVTRSGDDLILNMPGNVTFKTASADLNSNFYKVLDSVALVLKEFDKTLIDVEGHDSDGSDDYNQQLSMQRATSVGAYLQSHGVTASASWRWAGETRPIANNGTLRASSRTAGWSSSFSPSFAADRGQTRRWTSLHRLSFQGFIPEQSHMPDGIVIRIQYCCDLIEVLSHHAAGHSGVASASTYPSRQAVRMSAKMRRGTHRIDDYVVDAHLTVRRHASGPARRLTLNQCRCVRKFHRSRARTSGSGADIMCSMV